MPVTDTDGTRQATLLIPQGTTATIQLPGGGTQALTTLSLRATEYTVGADRTTGHARPLTPHQRLHLRRGAQRRRGGHPRGETRRQGRPVEPAGRLLRRELPELPRRRRRPRRDTTTTPRPPGCRPTTAASSRSSRSPRPGDPRHQRERHAGDAQRAGRARDHGRRAAAARDPLRFRPEPLARALAPPVRPGTATGGLGPPPDAAFWAGNAAHAGPPAGPCVLHRAARSSAVRSRRSANRSTLVGAPFRLHYASDRLAGRDDAPTLDIPVSGHPVPGSLKRVEIEVRIAGQRHTATFPAQPSQTITFAWDARDGYGRPLAGRHVATVRVGTCTTRSTPSRRCSSPSFGTVGGHDSLPTRTREQFTLWREARDPAGPHRCRSRTDGLGGWTLDVHHSLRSRRPGGAARRWGSARRRVMWEL